MTRRTWVGLVVALCLVGLRIVPCAAAEDGTESTSPFGLADALGLIFVGGGIALFGVTYLSSRGGGSDAEIRMYEGHWRALEQCSKALKDKLNELKASGASVSRKDRARLDKELHEQIVGAYKQSDEYRLGKAAESVRNALLIRRYLIAVGLVFVGIFIGYVFQSR